MWYLPLSLSFCRLFWHPSTMLSHWGISGGFFFPPSAFQTFPGTQLESRCECQTFWREIKREWLNVAAAAAAAEYFHLRRRCRRLWDAGVFVATVYFSVIWGGGNWIAHKHICHYAFWTRVKLAESITFAVSLFCNPSSPPSLRSIWRPFETPTCFTQSFILPWKHRTLECSGLQRNWKTEPWTRSLVSRARQWPCSRGKNSWPEEGGGNFWPPHAETASEGIKQAERASDFGRRGPNFDHHTSTWQVEEVNHPRAGLQWTSVPPTHTHRCIEI